MNPTEQSALRKQRMKLVLILALFILPIFSSWFLFNVVKWRPQQYMNHGELVAPARPLHLTELKGPDGTLYTKESWNKWTMFLIDTQACTEDCRKGLYKMRQLRISLGKHTDRVQNVLLLPGAPPNADLRDFLRDYPDLRIVNSPPEAVQKLLEKFKLEAKPSPGQSSALYLVDPLGNLMLYYAPDSVPRHMLKDLLRLMKISRIG